MDMDEFLLFTNDKDLEEINGSEKGFMKKNENRRREEVVVQL